MGRGQGTNGSEGGEGLGSQEGIPSENLYSRTWSFIASHLFYNGDTWRSSKVTHGMSQRFNISEMMKE